jgi:hypothetical protein
VGRRLDVGSGGKRHGRPPRREQITHVSFSPDNVHETGVSLGRRSGPPPWPPRRSRASELEERPGHGPDPRFLWPTRRTPPPGVHLLLVAVPRDGADRPDEPFAGGECAVDERGMDPQEQFGVERPVRAVVALPGTRRWVSVTRATAARRCCSSPNDTVSVRSSVFAKRPKASRLKSLWSATPAATIGCASCNRSARLATVPGGNNPGSPPRPGPGPGSHIRTRSNPPMRLRMPQPGADGAQRSAGQVQRWGHSVASSSNPWVEWFPADPAGRSCVM